MHENFTNITQVNMPKKYVQNKQKQCFNCTNSNESIVLNMMCAMNLAASNVHLKSFLVKYCEAKSIRVNNN